MKTQTLEEKKKAVLEVISMIVPDTDDERYKEQLKFIEEMKDSFLKLEVKVVLRYKPKYPIREIPFKTHLSFCSDIGYSHKIGPRGLEYKFSLKGKDKNEGYGNLGYAAWLRAGKPGEK